ncbi:2-hydroxyglutarate dehydrogenase [Beutenbergia cavernae DSM 12333]|uniref:2-hydroxyglutarate dehydrogenase n=1 Tax=Beutenbergia cavernae (strain ATCC BAA-8 / DSM 12333 / CCUG 43141 / JCM 11478 / NBRC 16432 / NCIMB 13614 / HKI 0122) TaxID=471853 RepID=C5C143_BEUC1|nr:L-2-hydroxyglutarate oxidase [Beutenbergia cavernae]ACQ79447.1 2-hydroxyglutarate dehydrogenase [Beutenbergia cavernae DSM 12333]
MHVVVVGSGIVGLATARELSRRGHRVSVLEKEDRLAAHQTGRNSGVIHSGLYYAPGSAKARMSVAGVASMTAFAREHGIRHEICGKLVVATERAEVPRLHALAERAEANGVPAHLVSADEARTYEPEVAAVEALRVSSTGIIDYVAVCQALAAELTASGGEVLLSTAFVAARSTDRGVVVRTSDGVIRADRLVNCAGLHSDRVALASGVEPEARIVPFRGEYFQLAAGREHLVRGLIYPVPDPSLPFLGVHLTRMVDGSVHAGPNAVLAFRREGYRWRDVDLRELGWTLAWPGTWRLGAKQVGTGWGELVRSASKGVFARSLARLVPAIRADDIVPAEAGVRAQALRRDGRMVDDFLVQRGEHQVHVLNAPSPAATCSLEIGRHVADLLV